MTMSSVSKRVLVALSLILSAGSACQPASAYYFGFSPYGFGGLGGYMLWPLQSMFYGFSNPYVSYTRAMTYPGLWNGSSGFYNPLRLPPVYPPNYMGTQDYQDPEPISDPRERTRASRPAPFVKDQVVSAGWNNRAPQSAQGPAPAPSPVPLAVPGAAAQAGPSGINAPLAAGFVDRVNRNFNGNIRDALSDPDTCTWAKAIGLIGSDDPFAGNLTSEHVDLVRRILEDPSLDAAHKVDAARALIKR